MNMTAASSGCKNQSEHSGLKIQRYFYTDAQLCLQFNNLQSILKMGLNIRQKHLRMLISWLSESLDLHASSIRVNNIMLNAPSNHSHWVFVNWKWHEGFIISDWLGANKVRPPFSSEKHRKSERMQLKEMVIYFAEWPFQGNGHSANGNSVNCPL